MPKSKAKTAKGAAARPKNFPGTQLQVAQRKGDTVAILITDFFGSIQFLCSCLGAFVLYILCNLNLLPWIKPFDPYPFPGLQMGVSVFAVVLSVSVLISQNRQRRMEKIREQVEFEVNVRAENEVTKILIMIHDIHRKLGIDKPDEQLEQMKEQLDINQIHKKIIKDGGE